MTGGVRAIRRKRRKFYSLASVFVLCAGFSAPVQASVRAWGCLLYASNAEKALELPAYLAAYDAPLRLSLGYSNYRVISQREIVVENQAAHLLVSAGELQVVLTSADLAPD